MKHWLWLSLLLIIYPVSASESIRSPYRFVFTSETSNFEGSADKRNVVNFLDPYHPTSPLLQLELPDGVSIYGGVSPNGEWITLFYRDPSLEENDYSRAGLMLLNSQTGQIIPVASIRGDDGTISLQWSPDSRYLLWNAVDFPAQNPHGLPVVRTFDLHTSEVITAFASTEEVLDGGIEVGAISARGWSPDGSRIAIIRNVCFVSDLDRVTCDDLWLEVYGFQTGVLLSRILLDDYVNDICGEFPTWSPDSRYLAFAVTCAGMFQDIPFAEVFVLDTYWGELKQLTANTNPHPTTWQEDPPPRYATYWMAWHDSNTLLVSTYAWLLSSDATIDPETPVSRTEAYTLPDGEAQVLSDLTLRFWSRNPITGAIAAHVVDNPIDSDGSRQWNSDRMLVFSYDGTDFTEEMTSRGGCAPLYWSPDGQILAYTLPNPLPEGDNCHQPLAIYFVDRDGRSASIPVVGIHWYQIVGWVMAPNEDVEQIAFAKGAPTPIPTPNSKQGE